MIICLEYTFGVHNSLSGVYEDFVKELRDFVDVFRVWFGRVAEFMFKISKHRLANKLAGRAGAT